MKEFIDHENSDIVMFEETKSESHDRWFVGSVWKGRNKEWAVLLAYGALGGLVIIWDALKFSCLEVIPRSFLVTIKLKLDEEGIFFWLTLVYNSINSNLRKNFWMGLQDLVGLTFLNWCVGGDFKVIRRIFRKVRIF